MIIRLAFLDISIQSVAAAARVTTSPMRALSSGDLESYLSPSNLGVALCSTYRFTQRDRYFRFIEWANVVPVLKKASRRGLA